MKKLGGIPIHPILIAVFPVLFTFSMNLGDFTIGEALGPLLRTALAAAGAWAVLWRLTKGAAKSGIVVSAFALLFFSYGHFVDVAARAVGARAPGWAPGVTVMAALAAAFAATTYLVYRAKGGLSNLTAVANVVAIVLVAGPLVRTAVYEARVWRSRGEARERAGGLGDVKIKRPDNPRNVYYIVLDAYGRSDKLKDLYGVDDSAFLSHLRSKGFYVAEKSRANYSHTIFSLASSLNARYMTGLEKHFETDDRVPLRELVSRPAVVELLRGAGYKIVSFSDQSELSGADVYIGPESAGEFGKGVWSITAGTSAAVQRARDRERITNVFKRLPETAEMGGPLFVYAHVMCPHEPFVFAADGSDPGGDRYFGTGSANHIIRPGGLTRAKYIELYRGQVEYVGRLAERAIDEILAKSKTPPVIVLQGDHGPGGFLCHERIDATYLGDRMSVLNALYLPDGGGKELYDTITPVNTFRVILRHYFGADCKLLPDESRFANEDSWRLTDVTKDVDSEADRARLEMLKGMEGFPVQTVGAR